MGGGVIMETISKAQHSAAAIAAQPSFKVPGFLERVKIKMSAQKESHQKV